MTPKRIEREAMDDLDLLLAALPPEVVEAVHGLPGILESLRRRAAHARWADRSAAITMAAPR